MNRPSSLSATPRQARSSRPGGSRSRREERRGFFISGIGTDDPGKGNALRAAQCVKKIEHWHRIVNHHDVLP